MEEKLKEFDLSQIQFCGMEQEVLVSIPKFKITTTHDLVKPLKELGMTDAFDSCADFSGITGKQDLFISQESF